MSTGNRLSMRALFSHHESESANMLLVPAGKKDGKRKNTQAKDSSPSKNSKRKRQASGISEIEQGRTAEQKHPQRKRSTTGSLSKPIVQDASTTVSCKPSADGVQVHTPLCECSFHCFELHATSDIPSCRRRSCRPGNVQ